MIMQDRGEEKSMENEAPITDLNEYSEGMTDEEFVEASVRLAKAVMGDRDIVSAEKSGE
jgi:hypothetical protein